LPTFGPYFSSPVLSIGKRVLCDIYENTLFLKNTVFLRKYNPDALNRNLFGRLRHFVPYIDQNSTVSAFKGLGVDGEFAMWTFFSGHWRRGDVRMLALQDCNQEYAQYGENQQA
jgi:hypothetical protein